MRIGITIVFELLIPTEPKEEPKEQPTRPPVVIHSEYADINKPSHYVTLDPSEVIENIEHAEPLDFEVEPEYHDIPVHQPIVDDAPNYESSHESENHEDDRRRRYVKM